MLPQHAARFPQAALINAGSARTLFRPSPAVTHAVRRAAGAADEREPEYASGDLSGYNTFCPHEPFLLRRGGKLPELEIAYETWGDLNHRRDNVILLQTGMSASSHARSHRNNVARGWWEDFIGPGRALDTNLFHVICTNNLGGCYGSTGPSSINPEDSRRYAARFPRIEVQDMVAAQFLLLDHLGIDRVHACVGASLGGMQSICAAADFPERVGKFVSISACAKSFPGSMAFRHAQRQAIMGDANWNGGDYYEGPLPAAGLRLARQIGTITYRSGQEWQQRFGQRGTNRDPTGLENEFEIERYLAHQGEKWVGNYDPNSVIFISKAMDGFTMEKPGADGQDCLVTGLLTVKQPALIIGVQTDVLFPVWQQKEVADALRAAGNRNVVYYELDSVYGHDAFLLEQQSISPAVKGHLEQEPAGVKHLWEDLAQSAERILQASAVRSNQADSLRDIFRTLAAGSDEVEVERLLRVTKLVWRSRVAEDEVARIFAKKLPNSVVTLPEFLSIGEVLQQSSHEVYLP